MREEALLLFIKNPVRGDVKTRLAMDIGDDKALAVYRQLLAHTRKLAQEIDAERYLFYAGPVNEEDEWSGQVFHKRQQHGADLGEKMQNAFAAAFQHGHRKAVIIGSDCPGLTSGHIQEAYHQLDFFDVVIGPAEDGGYYLLGMNDLHSALFEGKSWSNPALLQETEATCDTLGRSYYLLSTLRDIDDQDDLEQEMPEFLI